MIFKGPHTRLWSEETKTRLADRDWLYRQHVEELFSIVQIATTLRVTPNVVRKALRSFAIISPCQQQLREASLYRRHKVSNSSQVEGSRAKALSTMTEKFGGHVFAYTGRRAARNKTILAKYGTLAISTLPEIKAKAEQTNFERYGRAHKNQLHLSPESCAKLEDKQWLFHQHCELKRTLSEIAVELGSDMTIVMNRMRKFNIDTQHFFQSTAEKELLAYIKELVPESEVIANDRSLIKPYELDIVVVDKQIAFEYCGLYYHSNWFKDALYHRNKMLRCTELGLRLITIFEDEWVGKQQIVRKTLASLLSKSIDSVVAARKCTVVEVTKVQKNLFFDAHHIQGSGAGSITYGLLFEQHLVGVMTFIQNSDRVYVLNRYATCRRVIGGFTKLLSYFKKTHSWDRIVSFADLRWSQGHSYIQAGFVIEKVLAPDYSYIVKGERVHKFNFRHKYLPNKLSNYNSTLSERENAENNDLPVIYNCGLLRLVMTNTQSV